DSGILPGDEIQTILTTRGYVSAGISAPVTIFGGEGNDTFTVYHNKAVLRLDGGAGDDDFTVRAFAVPAGQKSQQATTEVKGGEGADGIQYAVNAPVAIDGGDGFDKLTVLGTEFADDFVVTKDSIFGVGLNVNYVNIERLEVDGLEGDDRYFVLSTRED